jgi:hypothetical protein
MDEAYYAQVELAAYEESDEFREVLNEDLLTIRELELEQLYFE